MKTLNLYFDFEFTSLSPDAQPISVGIVSDEVTETVYPSIRADSSLPYDEYIAQCERNIKGYEETVLSSKSFYAEFSDFDIERCDDWVKENVVGKLKMLNYEFRCENSGGNKILKGDEKYVKDQLIEWLNEQFSDYQIQFIVDCGTYDFYWLVQLLAIWDVKSIYEKADMGFVPSFRIGLPTLPINISPVPFDLNDLIAIKKGITPREAFDLNRETLSKVDVDVLNEPILWGENNKHNSLWDAAIIKEIYNKLK